MILGLREQGPDSERGSDQVIKFERGANVSVGRRYKHVFRFEKAVKRLESKNRRLLKKLDDLQHEYDAYVLMSGEPTSK